jgi:hypothetical protein
MVLSICRFSTEFSSFNNRSALRKYLCNQHTKNVNLPGEVRRPKLTRLSVAVAEVSGRNDIRGQELLMAQRPKKTPAFDFLHAIE